MTIFGGPKALKAMTFIQWSCGISIVTAAAIPYANTLALFGVLISILFFLAILIQTNNTVLMYDVIDANLRGPANGLRAFSMNLLGKIPPPFLYVLIQNMVTPASGVYSRIPFAAMLYTSIGQALVSLYIYYYFKKVIREKELK